jgi:hypothetical protein
LVRRELLTPAQQKSVAKDIARGIHKSNQRIAQYPVKLFLDSGVFGAWNRGQTLDIQAYCDFIKRNEPWLSCYAGMDVIPGKFGQARTMKQVEESAAQSATNQTFMRKQGLSPIPIFHQGESFQWLEKMLADDEPYIGISTAKDLTQREHAMWLDHVFSLITDQAGNPFVRTHGFGITTIPLLLRYPWYTCDSTTWSLAAGFGLIYVPGLRGGKPDYTQVPMRIIMSGRTQIAWSSARRQYENLGPFEKLHVDSYLEYLGLSIEQVRYQSSARRAACLRYFIDFHEHFKVQPFKHRQGAQHGKFITGARKAPPLWDHMSIVFATMMANGQFSQIMNAAKARNRLVSYYELLGKPDEPLRHYVEHGITDLNYQRRKPAPIWNDTYTSTRRMSLLKRIKDYRNADAT